MLAVAGRDGQGALELGATQPPYPNYVGPSLVVAAGRWALGGLLTRLGAVPFEHNEPDATCTLADTLASWRRATADGEKQPKAPVPGVGEAVEYEPPSKKRPTTWTWTRAWARAPRTSQ